MSRHHCARGYPGAGGAFRRLRRVPPEHCKEGSGCSGVHSPQSINREEVFDALAASGIVRDGGTCTEYERAKHCLASIWFADSADYDLMIAFIEEYVGL